MEFIDLKTQQKLVRDKLDANIDRVLDHGQYINGPEVGKLERRLADYVGVEYAVGCSSGTDALLMALMAYDLDEQDVVFTTSFTFIATAEVVRLLKAEPFFVDIDEQSFNIDVDKLESAIVRTKKSGNKRPRGIIPVNIFGLPADYNEINKLAAEHDMFVLEDAAQSFGATYCNKKSCSLAHVGATSFFPAKPLGCYGDGGMVFTNDSEIYEKLLSIRVHGKGENKYNNIRTGINGRLDTIQAAVLHAKFDIFHEELEKRKTVSNSYSEQLREICTLQEIPPDKTSAWAQYAVLHPQRDMIINTLKKNNIPTAVYYPKPLHRQGVFSDQVHNESQLRTSEKVSSQIFSLPMHPYLTESDQNFIVEKIRQSLSV